MGYEVGAGDIHIGTENLYCYEMVIAYVGMLRGELYSFGVSDWA